MGNRWHRKCFTSHEKDGEVKESVDLESFPRERYEPRIDGYNSDAQLKVPHLLALPEMSILVT